MLRTPFRNSAARNGSSKIVPPISNKTRAQVAVLNGASIISGVTVPADRLANTLPVRPASMNPGTEDAGAKTGDMTLDFQQGSSSAQPASTAAAVKTDEDVNVAQIANSNPGHAGRPGQRGGSAPSGLDSQKRWGNAGLKGHGVNSPAMMEARKNLAPVHYPHHLGTDEDGVHYFAHKVGMDRNGNHSVWVSGTAGTIKKIQTNGNAPEAHRIPTKGAQVGDFTPEGKQQLIDYRKKYFKNSRVESHATGDYQSALHAIMGEKLVNAGSLPGHAFRGNQYTHAAEAISSAPISDEQKKGLGEEFSHGFSDRPQFKPDKFAEHIASGKQTGASGPMTRQHFQAIADAIKGSTHLNDDERGKVAEHFAGRLSQTNPNFDHDRFVRAATQGGNGRVKNSKVLNADEKSALYDKALADIQAGRTLSDEQEEDLAQALQDDGFEVPEILNGDDDLDEGGDSGDADNDVNDDNARPEDLPEPVLDNSKVMNCDEKDLTAEDLHWGAKAHKEFKEGKNPPSWAKDEGKWSEAKTAAMKSYKVDDDAFWPVVSHIYEQMGGTVSGKSEAK